jgi:peptidyl-prolyl cis-trans isomerase C
MRLFLLPLLPLLPLITLTLAPQPPEAAKPVALVPVESPVQAVPDEAKPAPKVDEPLPAPAAPAKPKEDKILARIDGKVIRESEFELYLGVAYNEQQRMQIAMIEGARKQVQDQFLQYRLLEAKARREKMDQEKTFTQQRSFMEMDLLVRAIFNRDGKELQKKVNLQDEEVKAYFDQHPDRFMSKGSFSARHILVGVKGSPSQGDKGLTDEEAKAKIAKIQAELKAGKKLEDLTKEYSDDPGSKDQGGLYENKAFGEFVPEFEEAVRKQAVGQVGEPVKTMHGYHLIQVEKIAPPALPAFDEVKDKVRQAATMERQEQVIKAYIEEAKKGIPYVEGPEAAKEPVKTPGKAAVKGTPKSKKPGAAK